MSKKYLLLFIPLFLFTALFPQFSRAAADHIVISQIQVAGASATDEFVELFNPTIDTIDLTGYRLTKKVTSGTQSSLVASMSGSIAPNTYLLIRHPTGYDGSTSADLEYSTSSSVTPDNTVILYSDAGTTVVDKVGFGAPFEAETAAFAVNPAANSSIRRINNNDTDNNSVDFELLLTSDPRNSSTPTEEPTPSPSPTITPSPSPSPSPSQSPSPSPSPTQSPSPSPTPIQSGPTASPVPTATASLTPTASPSPTPVITSSPTPTIVPTSSPTPTLSPTATPSKTPTAAPIATKTPKPEKDLHHRDRDRHDRDNHYREIRLPFGFKCGFERREFEFKKHKVKYFKVHFHRR